MVSNASEDFPEPETPVTTVSALCGISTSMFLRLCTRAPRTTMLSLETGVDIDEGDYALPGIHTDALRRTTESSYYKGDCGVVRPGSHDRGIAESTVIIMAQCRFRRA